VRRLDEVKAAKEPVVKYGFGPAARTADPAETRS
jgi:hypothetical protein